MVAPKKRYVNFSQVFTLHVLSHFVEVLKAFPGEQRRLRPQGLLLTESESNAWVCRVGAGLEIVPNGISLALDPSGRTTGDAYVQFSSREVAETAMQRHKQKIGHRWGPWQKVGASRATRPGPSNGAPFPGHSSFSHIKGKVDKPTHLLFIIYLFTLFFFFFFFSLYFTLRSVIRL